MEDNIIALVQYGPGYVIAMSAVWSMGKALMEQRKAQERTTEILMNMISKLCQKSD